MDDTTADSAAGTATAASEAAPPQDRESRFAACLAKLEELKTVKARREVMEERVFLEFLRVNRGRLNEFPLLETEQQSLMDMLLRRAEGLHPGQAIIRERLVAYLVELNHYGKAKAVGDAAQVERLARKLEVEETLLAKMLQGAVYATSLVKDNLSDALIRHFGEGSLAKIEEITATMVFDEQYWRANIERFVKEEVLGAYDDILADRRYRLSREGQLLLVAYPFDAVPGQAHGHHQDHFANPHPVLFRGDRRHRGRPAGHGSGGLGAGPQRFRPLGQPGGAGGTGFCRPGGGHGPGGVRSGARRGRSGRGG